MSGSVLTENVPTLKTEESNLNPNTVTVTSSTDVSQRSSTEAKLDNKIEDQPQDGTTATTTNSEDTEKKNRQTHDLVYGNNLQDLLPKDDEKSKDPQGKKGMREKYGLMNINWGKVTLRILTLISLLVAIGFLLTPGSQNSRNNANIFLLVSFAFLAVTLINKHYNNDGMKEAYFAGENISLLMLGLVLLGGWLFMTVKARISMRFQHEWLIPIACLLFVLVLVPLVRCQSNPAKKGQGLDKVMQLILLFVIGISVVSVFAPGAYSQNTFANGIPHGVVLGVTGAIVVLVGGYIIWKGDDNRKLPQYPKSLFELNVILFCLFAVSLVSFLADSDVIPAQNFDTPRDVQDGINFGIFAVLLAVACFVALKNRNKKDDKTDLGPEDGLDLTDEQLAARRKAEETRRLAEADTDDDKSKHKTPGQVDATVDANNASVADAPVILPAADPKVAANLQAAAVTGDTN